MIPPEIELQGRQRRLYDFICSRPQGSTREQAMAYVYAEDWDGGPESSNIISVMVNTLNRKLNKLGIKIRSTQGLGALYTVVQCDRIVSTDRQQSMTAAAPRYYF